MLFVVAGQTSIEFSLCSFGSICEEFVARFLNLFCQRNPFELTFYVDHPKQGTRKKSPIPKKMDKTESGVGLSLHYIRRELLLRRVKG